MSTVIDFFAIIEFLRVIFMCTYWIIEVTFRMLLMFILSVSCLFWLLLVFGGVSSSPRPFDSTSISCPIFLSLFCQKREFCVCAKNITISFLLFFMFTLRLLCTHLETLLYSKIILIFYSGSYDTIINPITCKNH